MARTAKTPITSDWNYEVEKVKTYGPEGDWTGGYSTRRVDRQGINKGYLKDGVSKDYNVVQNRDLMEPVLNVLSDLGLEPTKTSHYVMNNGARFKARFEFKDTQVEIPKVGDTLGFRMDLDNSFNATKRIIAMGGALRLVCTNGMTTLDKEHGISCKHSNKFNVKNIVRAVEDALQAFEDLGKADNPFTLMASREVTQEQGLNILQNLTSKGTISEVRREGIARVWNKPTYQEDNGRNLYNLLNAVTEFTTHEVAETNFTMSETMNSNITKRLLAAAKDEATLNTLWTPAESDAVVVTA